MSLLLLQQDSGHGVFLWKLSLLSPVVGFGRHRCTSSSPPVSCLPNTYSFYFLKRKFLDPLAHFFEERDLSTWETALHKKVWVMKYVHKSIVA